jgi:hypothetical protein
MPQQGLDRKVPSPDHKHKAGDRGSRGTGRFVIGYVLGLWLEGRTLGPQKGPRSPNSYLGSSEAPPKSRTGRSLEQQGG